MEDETMARTTADTVGLLDGHTRESQIAAFKASCGGVAHPDQRVGTAHLRVEIAGDGFHYSVNGSSWEPTHAHTLRRRGIHREFDQAKLSRAMREAGFQFPRGCAKPGAVHTFPRRLPLWIGLENGECYEWIPGLHDFEEGDLLAVFPWPDRNEWTGAELRP